MNENIKKRMLALDAVRGLAVIGMFIQHFALNDLNAEIVSGNTMILFMICAGISFTLMNSSAKKNGMDVKTFRTKVLARSVFIYFSGYVLRLLNGPFGEVLESYALVYLLALLFRDSDSRTLLCISLAMFILCPPLSLIGMSAFHDAPLLRDIAGGPSSALGWAPVFFFGMFLGTLSLQESKTAKKLLLIGVVGIIPLKLFAETLLPKIFNSFFTWLSALPAYANRVPVDEYAIWPHNTQPVLWHYLFVSAPQTGSFFELAIGTCLACIILGLVILLENRFPRILHPFAKVGTAALTLYIFQFVLVWFLILCGVDIDSFNLGRIPGIEIIICLIIIGISYLLQFRGQAVFERSLRNFEKLFV